MAKLELVYIEDDNPNWAMSVTSDEGWTDILYGNDDDCDGEPHDWQPINTPRGRAYQCERCWDRTD